MLPAATAVAGPPLRIDRSADAVTVVASVEVLLAAFGSAVTDAIVAVFVSVAPCAGAVTTTVMVGAVAPVASAARVQVTETLPEFVHAQPVPIDET